MTSASVTRLGMAVAGVMLAHLVASKALRDAAFLSVWPVARLPLMMIVTAAAVVAAVPIYARLLGRWGPRRVVPCGFLLSAALHVLEWRLSVRTPWVAGLMYLHVAGLGAILLSGFWSLASEVFDPRTARASFGRIAAAGTLGGLAGGVLSAGLAASQSLDTPLLPLAAAHVCCAALVMVLGRAPSIALPASAREAARTSTLGALRAQPHLRTLAILIGLSTAAAAIVDYLFKASAQAEYAEGAALFQFFALFYTATQVITFLAQSAVGPAVRRLGLGRTISVLPAGLGGTVLLAFLAPVFEMFVLVRGVEAVLRGSLFRSGYELLFVPMDAAEKRRMKTFLDVTCDRAGDAIGAAVVQAVLLAAPFVALAGLPAELMASWWLLATVVLLTIGSLWVSRRLDSLYLGVVERQLVKHAEQAPVVVGSETGWTVINISPPARAGGPALSAARPAGRPATDNPRVRVLAELRSGDRARVEAALGQLTRPDRAEVADVIQLLAWDDLVPSARRVLERHAPAHVGLLVDVLLDQDTDFAIRRRIPRILGTLSLARAVDGLVRGLDDPRFEVRYGCARALDRVLAADAHLGVPGERVLAVVERELSVPLAIWQSHHVIDRTDRDEEPAGEPAAAERTPRSLEHVFTLLSVVLPREPVQVAFGGIRSDNSGLRGLAVEYLDSVLPERIRVKLYERL
jgi:hypothetical protein